MPQKHQEQPRTQDSIEDGDGDEDDRGINRLSNGQLDVLLHSWMDNYREGKQG